MKLNKTQTALLENLKKIVSEYGYWSNEVLEFNATLDHNTMMKINAYIPRTSDRVRK